MSDLTEFLLARIAEDEAVARAAAVDDGLIHAAANVDKAAEGRAADAAHIARHYPARVLAECEAKRRIMVEARRYDLDQEAIGAAMSDGDEGPYLASIVVRALALPYADHPDYRKEWRP